MRLIPKTVCATLSLALIGCSTSSSPSKPAPAPGTSSTTPATPAKAALKPGDDAAKAERAKLSPEDKALADAQEWCVVSEEPLGSMGVPIKVMVKDTPVFLCCKSCEDDAKKDPDKMLAKLKDLKAQKKWHMPPGG